MSHFLLLVYFYFYFYFFISGGALEDSKYAGLLIEIPLEKKLSLFRSKKISLALFDRLVAPVPPETLAVILRSHISEPIEKVLKQMQASTQFKYSNVPYPTLDEEVAAFVDTFVNMFGFSFTANLGDEHSRILAKEIFNDMRKVFSFFLSFFLCLLFFLETCTIFPHQLSDVLHRLSLKENLSKILDIEKKFSSKKKTPRIYPLVMTFFFFVQRSPDSDSSFV